MKKFVFIVLALGLAMCLAGCAKKDQSLTEMEEPISIEELGKLDTQATTPETTINTEPTVTPLPAVSDNPTVEQIQAALKNAGYYTGLIDGKKGPLTQKAIEDFQKANNLEADGKVGHKTWAVLSQSLNPQTSAGKQR